MGHVCTHRQKIEKPKALVHRKPYCHPCRYAYTPQHECSRKGEVRAVALPAFEEEVVQLIAVSRNSRLQGVLVVIHQVEYDRHDPVIVIIYPLSNAQSKILYPGIISVACVVVFQRAIHLHIGDVSHIPGKECANLRYYPVYPNKGRCIPILERGYGYRIVHRNEGFRIKIHEEVVLDDLCTFPVPRVWEGDRVVRYSSSLRAILNLSSSLCIEKKTAPRPVAGEYKTPEKNTIRKCIVLRYLPPQEENKIVLHRYFAFELEEFGKIEPKEGRLHEAPTPGNRPLCVSAEEEERKQSQNDESKHSQAHPDKPS